MMHPFKPPFTQVKVDGEAVKVRWVKQLPRFREGYSSGGDYGDGVIRIAYATNTRKGLRGAFVHEFMHYAVEREGGMPRKLSPIRLEEAVCGAAEWFAIMLLENPTIAAWLSVDLRKDDAR